MAMSRKPMITQALSRVAREVRTQRMRESTIAPLPVRRRRASALPSVLSVRRRTWAAPRQPSAGDPRALFAVVSARLRRARRLFRQAHQLQRLLGPREHPELAGVVDPAQVDLF